MSGSTEKATRRELRRAMGASAMHVVQYHQDVLMKNQIVPVTNDHQRRLADMETLQAEFKAALGEQQKALMSCWIPKRSLTFRERLRWLFRGVQ